MSPLLSVILPVYNGERYLSAAISSILSQTYAHFELIIVNDCSTDSTAQIIADFASKDDRIKIISNENNKKLPASLNVGHKEGSGDYFTWTSDDNIYQPNAFETYLKHIEDSSFQIVYSDFDLIDNEGVVLKRRFFPEPEYLINGNCVAASFLYKREVFEVLNGYNEDLFLVEDYDFWLRAFTKFRFKHIPESLYLYRSHPQSLSSEISKDDEKTNTWKTKLYTMYSHFLSAFTTKHKVLAEIFTKQLTYQSVPLTTVYENRINFMEVVHAMSSSPTLNKKNCRRAFKDKLIQLLVSNPDKASVFKFSCFIVGNFWRELKKNDIKTLVKYSFFK